ncbi:MAG: hypothetical protein J6C92_07260 [Bacteroidaceae bacterium]|nr:hypothetical protein [Bacteroidaceae bacterium]
MKKMICMIMLSILMKINGYTESNNKEMLLMFWNVENFFDYVDGGTGESDKEFSSFGGRRWSRRKFYAKCDAIAKSIFWAGEECGRMPDAIGFAEVENKGVLYKLLNSTLLRKYDYRIVHFDSGDRRGIDVALLYRESVFEKVSVSLKVPEENGRKITTRDILQVCLKSGMGQNINLIVNHHPSKFGGAGASAARRDAAMLALRQMCDSLVAVGEPHIVAMGDFNDNPDGEQFDMLDGILANMSDSLHAQGLGTIRYEGKWDLIDMFLVSPNLAEYSRMDILQIPFIMTYEKKYPGFKPLRTYSGPRYIGGVSDHCPIILKISDFNITR